MEYLNTHNITPGTYTIASGSMDTPMNIAMAGDGQTVWHEFPNHESNQKWDVTPSVIKVNGSDTWMFKNQASGTFLSFVRGETDAEKFIFGDPTPYVWCVEPITMKPNMYLISTSKRDYIFSGGTEGVKYFAFPDETTLLKRQFVFYNTT